MGGSACGLCARGVQEEEVLNIPLHVLSSRPPWATQHLVWKKLKTKKERETKGPERDLGLTTVRQRKQNRALTGYKAKR